MKNTLLCLTLLLSGTITVHAQKDSEKRTIYGAIENKLTREPCYGGTVELLRPDSSVISTCKVYQGSWDGKPVASYRFYNVPSGDYILRFTNPNFNTLYRPVTLKFAKREFIRSLNYTFLERKQKEIKLKGATVRATKVKIYTKNDTLIYNADAFQLAEGSMLDALIRQMPGVELKDDGQILVNGRYVESLLLNGEDFVAADRSIMLQNLPAYMVKDVKVYDRDKDRLNRLTGKADGPTEMVMDVHLKRQYSIGWIANTEWGAGSKDRFLGRLFAMRFTPHSRVTFVGNINNVNDKRMPGENGSWTPDQLEGGNQLTQMAMLDYMVNDVDKNFYVTGYARLDNSSVRNEYRSNTENFLTSGNTYDRYISQNKYNWLRMYTNHSWDVFVADNVMLTIKPHAGYSRYKSNGYSVSGTFLEDPLYRSNVNLMDSLYSPQSGALIRNILLNRKNQRDRYKYEKFDGNIDALCHIMLPVTDDRIEIGGTADYANQDEYYFRKYKLEYPGDPAQETDFRNEYHKNRPERRNKLTAVARYRYHATKYLTITPSYTFNHQYTLNRRSLYRLDYLENEWGEDGDAAFGALPSLTDWKLQTLDGTNSFNAQYQTNDHNININAYWNRSGKKAKQELQVDLPLKIQRRSLSYRRDGNIWKPERHSTFFTPNITYKYTTLNWRNYLTLNFRINASQPSLTNLVEFRDESNPLSITMGNANLDNQYTYSLSASYQRRDNPNQRYFNVSAGGNIMQDAIAMGYTYDHRTGIRTSRPENVNGNYNLYTNVGYNTPLDKAKRWRLNTNTSLNYNHSVDLYGTGEQQKSQRSTVGWTYLTEELKVDYSFSKVTVGGRVKATWGNASGSRDDFGTVNTGDMIYGLQGNVKLPWNMQISTDLNLYSRRGYNDRAMNTDDFVWNARLSKSLLSGSLVLMVDGFDILGNLSNVTRTLNAQGRTETYRNVVPRYVMVHAIYRLNIKPKKKPGE